MTVTWILTAITASVGAGSLCISLLLLSTVRYGTPASRPRRRRAAWAQMMISITAAIFAGIVAAADFGHGPLFVGWLTVCASNVGIVAVEVAMLRRLRQFGQRVTR